MTEALNIDVTISQELRELVAGQDLSVLMGPATEFGASGARSKARSPIRSAGPWSQCRLRQDGSRPMVFMGLPVLTLQGTLEALGGTYHHGFALYVSALREIYLSLSLTGPDDAALRPIHRCEKLDRTSASGVMKKWAEEVESRLSKPAVVKPDTQSDVLGHSALAQDLTAQGIRAHPVPTQRNEQCLQ